MSTMVSPNAVRMLGLAAWTAGRAKALRRASTGAGPLRARPGQYGGHLDVCTTLSAITPLTVGAHAALDPIATARLSQFTALFHTGSVVECGKAADIFTNPCNSRTKDDITGRYG